MGVRKKIVVLAVLGVGGATALYSPIALGLTSGFPVIGRLAGDAPESKREQILDRLASYEDKLLRGEPEADLPQAIKDRAAALNRAALASDPDLLAEDGETDKDNSELSTSPDKAPLSPPSASSLGLSGDEPFHVEAVSSKREPLVDERSTGIRDENQDRLIAELIKYRYRIKALEQELQAARNTQQLDREEDVLRGKPGELDREESQKIDELNGEVSRLKREASYSNQLKSDLSKALSRIDELKVQLEDRDNEVAAVRRGSGGQEKSELARQIKDLQAELAAKSAVLEKRNQEVSKLADELTRVGSQGKQIDQLKNERDKLASRVADFEQNNKSKAKLESDLEAVIKRGDAVAREKKEVEGTLAALREESSKTAEENAALTRRIKELEAAAAGADDRLSEATKQARLCSESLDKKAQVTAKVPELVKQLVETKNELLLREAELQTLGPDTAAGKTAAPEVKSDPVQRVAAAAAVQPKPAPAPAVTDVMVIQITADKANLRSGPGDEYAPVMQVERGMRMTVETQEGEWYRVITPTGGRAYVRNDVVNGNSRKSMGPAARPVPPSQSLAAASVRARPKVVPEDNALSVPFGEKTPAAANSVDDEETQAFEQLKDELMSKSRPR